ncbi:hypothetical protein M9458_029440, partial [Cirrhinus mrigala]
QVFGEEVGEGGWVGVQENRCWAESAETQKIQEAQEISIPSYSTMTPTTTDGIAGSHT